MYALYVLTCMMYAFENISIESYYAILLICPTRSSWTMADLSNPVDMIDCISTCKFNTNF